MKKKSKPVDMSWTPAAIDVADFKMLLLYDDSGSGYNRVYVKNKKDQWIPCRCRDCNPKKKKAKKQ